MLHPCNRCKREYEVLVKGPANRPPLDVWICHRCKSNDYKQRMRDRRKEQRSQVPPEVKKLQACHSGPARPETVERIIRLLHDDSTAWLMLRMLMEGRLRDARYSARPGRLQSGCEILDEAH